MQENKGLLSQKNEEGVSERWHLGKHEQDGPEARDPIFGDITENTGWRSMTCCWSKASNQPDGSPCTNFGSQTE